MRGTEFGNTIPEALKNGERKGGANTAVTAPGRAPMSHHRLGCLLRDLATQLNALGAGRGTRVAIAIPPGPEAVVATLGALHCSVAAPLNPGYRQPEHHARLARLKADCLLADVDAVPAAVAAATELGIPVLPIRKVPGGPAGEIAIDTGARLGAACAPAEARPDDIAMVIETSGTSGLPKRVPLTHANLCISAATTSASVKLDAADRLLSVVLTHHVAGVALVLPALAAGSGVCCAPGFSPAAFLEWMDEYRPTWLFLTPALVQELVKHARLRPDLMARCGLRFIRTGAAPLPAKLMAEAEQVLGAPVLELYGMTEAAPAISCNHVPPKKRKPGSAGLPACPEVKILGEGGRAAAIGEKGEILVRGPNMFQGYEDDPEANAAAFLDGWFRTGDVGWFDEEGYLYIAGRLKEVINRGGEKIFPAEVEEVLLAHPSVAQAAVFPVPHARLSETVAAAVVLREGESANERAVRIFARARLSRSKVPERVVFVAEIPKGPGGKPQRNSLAARLGLEPVDDRRDAAPFAPPESPLQKKLARLWCDVLRVPRVGIHDNFFDLGGDSFAAALLLAGVQEQFGAGTGLLEQMDFLDAPTIADMAGVLEGHEEGERPPGAGQQAAALALRPTGSRIPLFCVPWQDEDPFYLLPLVRELGPEQPFYVLRDPERPEHRGSYTLADAARKYVQAMRTIQPRGPYAIAGHCLGGIVAFEAARQVMAAGEEVGLLVLMDTPTPGYPNPVRHWKLCLSGLRFHIAAAFRSRRTAHQLAGAARTFTRHVGLLIGSRLLRLAARFGRPVSRQPVSSVIKANFRAAMLYEPGTYPGGFSHLLARDHPQTGSPLDRRLGWRELASGAIDLHWIGGNHFTMVEDPHVRELAAKITSLICAAMRR